MNKRFKIVGAGFSCLDIIKQDKGELYLPGGTCANVLAVLADLGWDASLLKPEYSDVYDKYINESLASLGIKIIAFSSSSKRTPRVIQTAGGGKHHFYTVCPVCKKKLIGIALPSRKNAGTLKEHLIDSNVLYYDRISDGIKELVLTAVQNDIWTFYEPNSFRNYQQFIKNVSQANIVKFSSERVPMGAAEKLKEDLGVAANTALIIVTMAEAGILYAVRQKNGFFSEWRQIKGKIVSDIVDSSGAGDWLTAGFINSLAGQCPKAGYSMGDHLIFDSLTAGQSLSQRSFNSAGALGAFFRNTNACGEPIDVSCQYCKI